MGDPKDSRMACDQHWDPEQFLPAASPNDPELLTEIQRFSENDPIFHEETGDKYTISRVALEVVYWLQVCPTPRHSGRPGRLVTIPIIY